MMAYMEYWFLLLIDDEKILNDGIYGILVFIVDC